MQAMSACVRRKRRVIDLSHNTTHTTIDLGHKRRSLVFKTNWHLQMDSEIKGYWSSARDCGLLISKKIVHVNDSDAEMHVLTQRKGDGAD